MKQNRDKVGHSRFFGILLNYKLRCLSVYINIHVFRISILLIFFSSGSSSNHSSSLVDFGQPIADAPLLPTSTLVGHVVMLDEQDSC